ncbi:MAG: DEAD/DEAH box helicase [Treponema sp.]|jgi:superfamily II DNA/RNA helicase|nr:DEAD/DEAH box helicase [Treponema sp.]
MTRDCGGNDNGFAGLGVSLFFIGRLKERGIRTPEEIQRRVIPRLFRGERVLFSSPTGTGKTFAYLIPVFQKMMEPAAVSGNGCNTDRAGQAPQAKLSAEALILAPTYELCSQIKQEAEFLLSGAASFKVSLLIGSGALSRQIETLKKDRPRVLVGNPGRVLQLVKMGKLRLGNLRFLVLDEADRLSADELYGETRELVSLIRSGYTAACSATLPDRCRERLLSLMGEKSGIFVEETRTNEILRDRIEHWAFFCEERDKIGLLRSFLAALRPRKALVFTSRGAQVGNIVSKLQYHGISALGLYGDMDKRARKQAMDDFRRGRSAVLVASDLAARGLDIPDVSHIISLDTGADPDAYIHRAGRTARAGKRGIMATFGDEAEMRALLRLEKKLGIIVYPKELYAGKVRAPSPMDHN